MPTPLLLHIIFFSLMILLALGGIIIAIRKKKKWFQMHRAHGAAAVLFGIAGFLTLFISKQMEGIPHFSTVHTKIGLIGLILMIGTLLLGTFLKKLPGRVKKSHRIAGAAALIVSTAALITGVLLILPA